MVNRRWRMSTSSPAAASPGESQDEFLSNSSFSIPWLSWRQRDASFLTLIFNKMSYVLAVYNKRARKQSKLSGTHRAKHTLIQTKLSRLNERNSMIDRCFCHKCQFKCCKTRKSFCFSFKTADFAQKHLFHPAASQRRIAFFCVSIYAKERDKTA